MAIASRAFGETGGKRVDQFTLEGDDGLAVDIITWGGVVRDWRVPVAGRPRSVVLGFDDLQSYLDRSPYFGALVGRVANRIEGARFDLDGKTYRLPANWPDPPRHALHGGPQGFSRLIWDAEPDEAGNRVRLSLRSPDGAMGFPGNVEVTATYTLTGHRLRLDFHATTDRRTPISLVQHHYFNLGATDTVLDHTVEVNATHFTPTRADLIPTGEILPVDGTPWDLRRPRTMRDAAGAPLDYDGNVVLAGTRDKADPVARVTGEDRALTLALWTDQPGLQVYNGVWTPEGLVGLGGKRYAKYSGFCLEDQAFPDALHHPNFGSIICEPGSDYSHWCEIEIAPA
jgi:aldose 1-epimerase